MKTSMLRRIQFKIANQTDPEFREVLLPISDVLALLTCADILRELLTECPSTLDEVTFPKRGITDANRKQVVFMLSVSADRIKRGEESLAALYAGGGE